MNNLKNINPINLAEEGAYYSVAVTPAVAYEWLERNKSNRKISPGAVSAYANAMLKGEWMPNTGTIEFDKSGMLIDGQHRLCGVLKSQTTQVFTILTGQPREKALVIDTGKTKKPADMLAMGETKLPLSPADSAMVAGAIGMLMAYTQFPDKNTWSDRTGGLWLNIYNNQSVFGFFEDNADEIMRNLSIMKEHISKKGNIMTAVDILFFLTIFSRENEQLAIHFLRAIVLGENLTPHTTLYNLRDAYLDVKLRKTTRRLPEVRRATMHCWRSIVAGRNIKNKKSIFGR